MHQPAEEYQRAHKQDVGQRSKGMNPRRRDTQLSSRPFYICFESLQKEDMFSRLKRTSMFIHMTARPMKLHNQATYLAVKMYFVLF